MRGRVGWLAVRLVGWLEEDTRRRREEEEEEDGEEGGGWGGRKEEEVFREGVRRPISEQFG